MRRIAVALGKKKVRQEDLFVAAALRKGPGHPFYTKPNAVLAGAGFGGFVETLCAPH